MTTKLNLLLTILLLTLTLTQSRPTRLEPISDQLKENSKGNDNNNDINDYGSPGGYFGLAPGPLGAGCGDCFGNGGSYTVASGCDGDYGFGNGGSYAVASDGYSKGGVVRPTLLCKEKGHCFMKKLRCPAKCFTSTSISGSGFGGGGGGGGCIMDCKKCKAYCFEM